jgi:hypothetical protein
LAGRYSCDYYGHSVAIGLAPRRRSHVHQRCMYQRDLGVPFVSFNTRTGHRSSAPEDCGRFVVTLPQGPVPVSGVFPAGVLLHLLETGIQAIQLSPYHTDHPTRRSRRLDTTAGFLACYFPRSPFRATGQPSDPETSPLVPARYASDTTLRLVAQLQHPPAAPGSRPGRSPTATSPVHDKPTVSDGRTSSVDSSTSISRWHEMSRVSGTHRRGRRGGGRWRCASAGSPAAGGRERRGWGSRTRSW